MTISAGTLTITPAPLVVTPDSFARLYGAANPTLTGTLSGVENGDAITASFSTPADASSPAGAYSITAALSGAKLHDYTVTASTGTLTVTPAPLVVTASADLWRRNRSDGRHRPGERPITRFRRRRVTSAASSSATTTGEAANYTVTAALAR